MDGRRNQMPGQIPIYGQSPKPIVEKNPINGQSPKPIVLTVLVSIRHPNSIDHTAAVDY